VTNGNWKNDLVWPRCKKQLERKAGIGSLLRKEHLFFRIEIGEMFNYQLTFEFLLETILHGKFQGETD
jgi:hypothetical protein